MKHLKNQAKAAHRQDERAKHLAALKAVEAESRAAAIAAQKAFRDSEILIEKSRAAHCKWLAVRLLGGRRVCTREEYERLRSEISSALGRGQDTTTKGFAGESYMQHEWETYNTDTLCGRRFPVTVRLQQASWCQQTGRVFSGTVLVTYNHLTWADGSGGTVSG